MITPPADHTLAASSVNLILFVARQKGADADVLARAAGIDARQLTNPDGRIPIRQMQTLWREVIAATGNPNLPLQLGQLVNPVAFGVLAYVMMNAPTLGRSFDKLCQYQEIACDGIRTTGRLDGDRYVLTLRLTSPDIIYPQYALNSELSIYLSAMRALTGQFVTVEAVQFAYPRPADTAEHARVFGPGRLTFDAPDTGLVLDAALLDLPVLNASPTLSALFDEHATDLLNRLRTPSLTARVRDEIVRLMKGEEPALTTVADRLAMGVRTLQLHLRDEGVTYQQLLDDVRKGLAVSHLRDQNLSTTDIAYLLGFAEPSVFFRSFKKWTGQTPGAFRLAQAA